MKTLPYWKVLSFSLLILGLASCHNSASNSEINSSVARHSGPLVEAQQSVKITFKSVPELFNGLSEVEKNNVFEFSPEVTGSVFRIDQNTLVFQPDKAFSYGQEYTVKIHLNKLFNHTEKDLYEFKIRILPLKYSLHSDNLEPYGKVSENISRLKGSLSFSNVVKQADFIRYFTVKQGNELLPVKVEPTDNNLVYSFVVDSIRRSDKRGEIKLQMNGKEFGAYENKEWTYEIPPVSKFLLVQYNVVKTPEVHISLVFSDFLQPDQNIQGLVYFQDGTPVRIAAKGNEIQVYPQQKLGGSHALVISKGIRNNNADNLDKEYIVRPFFEMAPPQVRFIGGGNILPGNKQWIVPFEAVNLKAVDVVIFKIYANNIKQFLQQNELSGSDWNMNRVGEFVHHQKIILDKDAVEPENKWQSYAIDLTKMIKASPGAIYRVGLRFRKPYAMLDCKDITVENNFSDSTSYYYSNYYYPNGYSWNNRNNPCDNSYYNYQNFKERNFIAGNIGLTVLGYGNNDFQVFARDLLNVKPFKNVKVQFYSFQNQKLVEAITDDDGKAEVHMKKEPSLLVAQEGNQYAYLRLQGGTALSFSKFETDGVQTENGLKGIIFGERGVWRPGDTLFLTFVLQDLKQILPAGFPVRMEVSNARNKKVFSAVATHGVNDFYVFKVPTSTDAPTGLWKAKVIIGNNQFTKNLRIETILPNRLKIDFKADADRFVSGKNQYIDLKSVWLHGGLASNLKANVTESITAGKVTFEGHKDYNFNDPAKRFFPEEQTVFDGKLDSLGRTRFKVMLPQGNSLPGRLNLSFIAKVFEPGGRFSIDQKKYEYSPYDRFVGLKVPEKGSEPFLETDRKQIFRVVTLDDQGRKVSVRGIKAEVYKLDWSWWYNSNESNLGSYISRNYEQRIYTTTINTIDGEGQFSFEVRYPGWGNFYVKVTDESTGYSAGTVVYLDWPSTYSRSGRKQPGDATLLSLSADKKSYKPGDEVHLSFPSPPNAKALISILKNNQVVRSWWVNTTDKESDVSFKVTKEMTPNVYAFVSVIQPHLQTENDLPMRSYGVIPIVVNDPATELKPVLNVPDQIKPNSTYQVSVKEAEGKKMTYVLAVVDEGLLDLTHFKTPSLHEFFYKKEALAVNVWDFYNQVNGAYGGKLLHVFAIGGDQDQEEQGKKKVNRFKPVVSFLGPFTLPEGSKGQNHQLKMGDYVGSVRVMVVAGNQGAYGSIDKQVPVKQALMVLASLPRTLMPGETLVLPVTVFAMEDGIQQVNLNVQSNDMFTVEHPEQSVIFNHPGDKVAYVELKVADKEGVGKLKLQVESGKHKASYDVQISIRNPNERAYKTVILPVVSGKSVTVVPDYLKRATGHQLSMSVSKIPSIDLKNRLQYLLTYPYGCIEQTVSSVLPQLFLDKLVSLTADQKSAIEQHVNQAIIRLSMFQRPSGGMSYWPRQSWTSNWGTSYAGQFMLLAKEAGYYVPSDMLNNWLSYQMEKATQWNVNTSDYNDDALDQAYRLYTLALAGQPNLSAMNRMREMKNLQVTTALRLAAAYALINEKGAAGELLKSATSSVNNSENNWRYNYGSVVRDEAMAMETYVLTGDKVGAFDLFKKITKSLGSNEWMSTQTTSFALYAVSRFVGDFNKDQVFDFEYNYNGKKDRVQSLKPVFSKELDALPDVKLEVQNKSKQILFLTLSTSAVPLPGENANVQQGLNLSVKYYDMKGYQLDANSLPQGKDFYAKIQVKNTTFNYYNHLALSAIFPSGWEILNTRMTDLGKDLRSSSTEYTDIRDDRVDLFFDLDRNQSKTFYVLLNAAYPGVYFMPQISCSAMYDHAIQAATGGGKVKVNLSK
ncbi:MAG: hypothetical protein JXR65_05510 [Bacteroidales bacterium]|nr:hypothetical protein [Bacteroidales bacterium]